MALNHQFSLLVILRNFWWQGKLSCACQGISLLTFSILSPKISVGYVWGWNELRCKKQGIFFKTWVQSSNNSGLDEIFSSIKMSDYSSISTWTFSGTEITEKWLKLIKFMGGKLNFRCTLHPTQSWLKSSDFYQDPFKIRA